MHNPDVRQAFTPCQPSGCQAELVPSKFSVSPWTYLLGGNMDPVGTSLVAL